MILEKQLSTHHVDRSICLWFWEQVIARGDPSKVSTLHFSNFNLPVVSPVKWNLNVAIWGNPRALLFFLEKKIIHFFLWLMFTIFLISFCNNFVFIILHAVASCDCFTYTLSLSNFSRRNHILSLYTGRNATPDGYRGAKFFLFLLYFRTEFRGSSGYFWPLWPAIFECDQMAKWCANGIDKFAKSPHKLSIFIVGYF